MALDHLKKQQFISEIKNRVHNHSGKILYLCLSGSHLYGFSSEDSDMDFRGCFQIKTNKLLTTRSPREYIQILTMKDGVTLEDAGEKEIYEIDSVLHELKKEVGLLLAGNCNFNEHLFAKPLLTSQEHVELRNLIGNNLNMSGLVDSYGGMANHNYKKFILNGMHTPKKFLYVMRGLMAALYVIRNGKIESNIENLNKEEFDSKIVAELVELKKRGMEKAKVNKRIGVYIEETEKLFDLLNEERENIPYVSFKEKDEIRNKLDAWLHDKRLEYIDTYV